MGGLARAVGYYPLSGNVDYSRTITPRPISLVRVTALFDCEIRKD